VQKIKSIFVRDVQNMRLVTRTVTPGCEWVFEGKGNPTVKHDGTAVMFWHGRWWKRYTLKFGKNAPAEFVRAQPEPEDNGTLPGWLPFTVALQRNDDKWLWEAIKNTNAPIEGMTYEAIGPHFRDNPHEQTEDRFVEHGNHRLPQLPQRSYESIRDFLRDNEIEGIVWHWKTDNGLKMAKIKRRDFGLAWPVKK